MIGVVGAGLGAITLLAMGSAFAVGNISLLNASASVVQSFGAANTSMSTTLPATAPTATTTGDLLVATIKTREESGAAATVTGVADSGGNTWTQATGAVATSGPNDGEIWYTPNALSDTTVTVSVSGTGAAIAFTVVEVAGAATTSPLDQTAENSSSTATTAVSIGPTATTTQANEIAIADVGWNGSGSKYPLVGGTTGYSSASTAFAQSSVASDNAGEGAAWQILTATGPQSYAATLGASAAWTGTIATFYLGSAPPTLTPTPTVSPTPTPTPLPTNNPTSAPHVMLIVEENQCITTTSKCPTGVIGGTGTGCSGVCAPYITSLANTYASATNWYAVQHNSPHDYLDLIVGSDLGLPTGAPNYTNTTLVDELHSANIPWVSYMESMPSDCFKGTVANGLYDPNHNPFHYFAGSRPQYTAATGGWCSPADLSTEGVVPYPGASGMVSALDASGAPDFVYLVPNDCDEMHGDTNSGSPCASDTNNQLIMAGDGWLSSNLPNLLTSSWFKANGTVIITWDESVDGDASGCCGLSSPGGHIATIVISSSNTGLGNFTGTGDHYGTLRAIEEQYGVALLGGSSSTAGGDLTPAFGKDGSVSGTVNDSVTNTGISGATVTLNNGGGTTTTSSNGGYSLTSVPPGTYTATASATGHVNQVITGVKVTAGSNAIENFSLTPNPGSISGTVLDNENPQEPVTSATVSYSGPNGHGSTNTINATTGAYTLSGVPVGTYTVTASANGFSTVTTNSVNVTAGTNTPGVSFTLVVGSSISGSVADTEQPTGLPIGGATVTYTGTNGSIGHGTAITASNGTYTLPAVPPGTYNVSVAASGFTAPAAQPETVIANTPKTGVNFAMTANSNISGTVMDTEQPTSQPVGGATVTYTGTGSTTNHGSTVTAANGTYTLASVPAGTYSVSLTDSAFNTPTPLPETVVINTPKTGVSFTLTANSSIAGTVTDAEQPTGLPIGGATVTYTGTGTTTNTGSTVTAANGTYTLAGVPAGTYNVTVAASGFTTPTAQPVNLPTSTAKTGVNFTMTANSNISGKVMDTEQPTSQPVGGATVTYTGTGGTTNSGSTTTAANGTYTLVSVPAGTYSVSVTDSAFNTATALPETVVINTPKTGVNFTLTANSSISGNVVDTEQPTAQPVGGATVTYTGTGGTTNSGSTVTASNGTYTLAGVPAGTYSVAVTDSGYTTPASQPVNLAISTPKTGVNFTMAATTSISGAVTDTEQPTGQPVGGATVTYTGTGSTTNTGSTTTASNGNYTLMGVPAGTYSVSVADSGFTPPTPQPETVGSSSLTGVDFTMAATSSVTGMVSNGVSGISGAMVSYVATSGSNGQGNTTADVNGNYTLAGVPPGTYSVTASALGYTPSTQPGFVVSPGGSPTQNFTLSASAGTISGTVSDGGGPVPMGHGLVSYAGPAGSGNTATSDSAGDYTLTNVPPGTYLVTASDVSDGDSPETIEVSVSAGPTTPVDFTLKAGIDGSITGNVIDAQTSQPVSGVTVSDGVDPTTTTTAAGNYIIQPVAPGTTYTLTFAAPNYVTGSISPITVTTDANTSQNESLTEVGTVNGTVTDAVTHTAIQNATVTCTCGTLPTTTGPTGAYSFTGVTPGSGYTVSVTATGYNGQTSSPFGVTANNTTTVPTFNLVTTLQVAQTFGTFNTKTSGLTSTLAVSPPSATGTGDLLVVAIRTRVTGTGPATVIGVTDTASNTWTKATSVVQGTSADEEMWYVPNSTSVPSTGTITVTTSETASISMTVFDVVGAPTTSPLDQVITSSGKATPPQPSVGPTSTISQPNEIVIADIGWNSTETLTGTTAGYTASPTVPAQQSTVTGDASGEQAAWEIVNASGTETFGGTLSATAIWTGLIATFK